MRDRLYALVIDEFNGSFSAEHGIGIHNMRYFRRYTAPVAMALKDCIRQLLDPMCLCGAVNFAPYPAQVGFGESFFQTSSDA